MSQDHECARCKALEGRCADLERQLAEARHERDRASRPGPGVDPEEVTGLTSRELEVLHLIAQGLSTDEIADQLYLSRNSVKTHTRKLYRKIGVSNRTEAAVWALSRVGGNGQGPPTDGVARPDGVTGRRDGHRTTAAP